MSTDSKSSYHILSIDKYIVHYIKQMVQRLASQFLVGRQVIRGTIPATHKGVSQLKHVLTRGHDSAVALPAHGRVG